MRPAGTKSNGYAHEKARIKAALDVDCLVAGTLAGSGAAHDLISLWRDGAYDLVACPALLTEFADVMSRPRISNSYGISQGEVEALIKEMETEGLLYPDTPDPRRRVTDDPEDDYLVALAILSEADFLVTRDRHLHDAPLPDLKVLYPGQFRALLAPEH